jgi:hypothetical protein
MTSVNVDRDIISLQDEISFDNVRGHGPAAVKEFLSLVEKGESVKMAEMLVTRRPPSLGITDQTYQKNKKGDLLSQFDGSQIVLDAWNREYKRRTGEDIPSDAVIFRGLANGTGDPAAVMTHKHSLADIKRVMKERNVPVEGDWEIVPESRPPVVQAVRMAPDLVDNYVREYIAENPDLANTDRREIEEMVIDNHSRQVTQNDLEPLGTNDFKSLAAALYRQRSNRITIPIAGDSGAAGAED